jgi:transcriptional regulator GlxA family with amidase domain
MRIAVAIYEDFTALDVIGPYEVLAGLPDVELDFLATSAGPIRSDNGLIVTPTATPESLPDPDIMLIGGSSKPFGPLQDEALLAWVRQASDSATWMASVCTGALVYGAAGVIKGRKATTHWAAREALPAMGVEMSTDRVVFDGNFVSGAGVSAGIDMALSLAARIYGDETAKAVQLAIEYDPQPPFDSGSPEKAGPETMQLVMEMFAASAAAS